MNKEIKLSDFNLSGFINETIEGRKGDFTPREFEDAASEFCVVTQEGEIDEGLSERIGRSLEKELVDLGYTIFFPFAGPSYDKVIQGVDGERYTFKSDEECALQQDIDSYNTLPDCIIGYTVNVRKGIINIKSATNVIGEGGPYVKEEDPFEEFSDGMNEYVNKFIKQG